MFGYQFWCVSRTGHEAEHSKIPTNFLPFHISKIGIKLVFFNFFDWIIYAPYWVWTITTSSSEGISSKSPWNLGSLHIYVKNWPCILRGNIYLDILQIPTIYLVISYKSDPGTESELLGQWALFSSLKFRGASQGWNMVNNIVDSPVLMF